MRKIAPIVASAHAGNIQWIEIYAAFALSLDKPDKTTHRTPLTTAIAKHRRTEAERRAAVERLAVVKRLVELGADVRKPDGKGATPLSVALQTNQPEIAAFLKQQGATR